MPALCVEPAIHEPVTVSCVTTAPILKKMKVLKKFKRRMGLTLTTRSESAQLPPLLFHQVCGDNVRIENDGKVARRVESFCKGISFSNRPVKVGEKVYVKLIEISSNWSGVIRFGFTSQDPTGLRDALPKYACPDLTSKPGYWAKALSERFAQKGLVVFYYFTSAGDVHFGINGEEKGVFFNGVETRSPLWTVIDVYGNSTGVEFLDPLAQMNNRVRIVNDLRPGSTTAQSRVLPQPPSSPSAVQQRPLPEEPCPPSPTEIENLQPSMAQLALNHRVSRFYSSSAVFTPFPLHRVRGRHVVFNSDRTVVSRVAAEYSHGYVFSGRPLRSGETFVIQIQESEPMYVGALAFGLTAANPAGLESADLPEDCDLLLDRPEYWVVSKDVASSPVPGDELAFGLTSSGEVTFAKNGGAPQTVMHVDNSLQLWAFFDVYGNTKKVKMLGTLHENSVNQHTVSRRMNSGELPAPVPQYIERPPRVGPPPPPTPLTVSLPPSPPRSLPHDRTLKRDSGSLPGHQNTLASIGSSTTYAEPVSLSPPGMPGIGPTQNHHECTVCYEKAVDSVLYMCGHMCMCYGCAIQQWRGRGGGQCPICRAPIRDVIRTYRS